MIRACAKAFSLVEVVLAIGIVGFSMLATIGLLSVGHDTNKRARDEGFAAQIVANEFERIRSLSAGAFPSGGAQPSRYFDSEMKKVNSSVGATYELRVDFVTAPSGTADWLVNAEVRNPPQAANPTISRFTILVRIPDS
jgi:uncharacterized protein (TIGR02598 family)